MCTVVHVRFTTTTRQNNQLIHSEEIQFVEIGNPMLIIVPSAKPPVPSSRGAVPFCRPADASFPSSVCPLAISNPSFMRWISQSNSPRIRSATKATVGFYSCWHSKSSQFHLQTAFDCQLLKLLQLKSSQVSSIQHPRQPVSGSSCLIQT